MSFVHPAFLWALTALAIPVLIHLFQLRRFKRIDFPNVRLLAEVSQQTRARKKVQHWLVLLARCLALASLVFAFAQPYIPDAASNARAGQRALSLFIDDSFSMDGQNADGRLLDQARKGGQDAVMAHEPTDRFQVLSGRFEGRQQLILGRDEALEAIGQVDASPFTRPLSQVLLRQREALSASQAPVKKAFLFTDLQRSVTDVEQWTNDTLVPTVIVPLIAGEVGNLSIDSAWFASPVRRAGQNEVLHVRVRNHGSQDLVNVPLRLTINGQQRALANFGVEANSSVDTVLRFASGPAGRYQGEVTLTDQPVVFDDRLFLAYRVSERLRILLLSGAGETPGDRAVSAVFANDSIHRFTQRSYRSTDLSLLEQQDLVVLNGLPEIPSGWAPALEAFVSAGGSLAVFPPEQGDPIRYADLFNALGLPQAAAGDTTSIKVERIDLEHPFYRDVFQTMPRNVDLPVVRERWALRLLPGSDVLLRLQDGNAFLASTARGPGSIYMGASPLSDRGGNLMRHALFATSLLRMAELARPMGELYHTIGAGSLIPLEDGLLSGEQPPRLVGPDGMELMPEVRRMPGRTALVLHDQDLPPGAYAVVQGMDTLMTLALNQSRRESDLDAMEVGELRAALEARGLDSFTVLDADTGDLSLRLTELGHGRKLWKWFIALALLFLTAEVLLIRTRR